MKPHAPPTHAWLLAVLLVALPLAGAPASAAPKCGPATTGLACADASSTATLTCSTSAGTFTCSYSGTRTVSGTTGTAAPGQVAAFVVLEIGYCDAATCVQTDTFPGGGCSWAVSGGGCTASGSFSGTLADSYSGCLYVWVEQTVESHVRPPVATQDLAMKHVNALVEYDSCA